MRAFLKNTAVLLAVTGASLATAVPSSAAGFTLGVGGDYQGSAVSLSFNDVAYGYRDGYWDKSHRWQRWKNDRDHRYYRSHNAHSYRDWNHDRYGSDGWAGGGNFDFQNVVVGYRDGYWDNGRRWHGWNNDSQYQEYRRRHAGNYRDWDHDRDGGDGWQRGRSNDRDGRDRRDRDDDRRN